jgi:SAM-dependent methyltransferase
MSVPPDPASPNAEQVRYWNEVAGPKWAKHQGRLDDMIGPLGAAAIDRAAPHPGERVLDVGCGCGATALELRDRVGDRGEVLGVDLSEPMLEVARGRTTGMAGVRFEKADAQTEPLPSMHFDLVFSRFGVMFFADPIAAFANLRRALRPSGRLAFLCWQPPTRNPWMMVPMMALADVIPLPPPPPPEAPGPFSLGDPARIEGILGEAGFRDVAIDAVEQPIWLGGRGGSLDDVVDFALQLGPALNALADASADQKARAAIRIRDALSPYAVGEDVQMHAATWVVTARPS